MSKERITIPTTDAEEKRKKVLRRTLSDLRKFQRKILESHGGKPLPESISDVRDDAPLFGIMYLAEKGGSFDHVAEESDLYSVEDLKVRYK